MAAVTPLVDTRPAQLILMRFGRGLEQSPKRFKDKVRRRFAYARSYILYEAHTAPYQSPLPFIWSLDPIKQAKARAWWFAHYVRNPKRPRGARNRYVRTAKLDQGTQVIGEISETTGKLTLQNERKGAYYVFGPGQNPSHERSGHPLFVRVANKWGTRLADQLVSDWLDDDLLQVAA